MGVVVGDYEGATPTQRGFFLQDLTGDGDAATSDGIFVFNGNNNSVSLGDVVRVTGSAADYQGQTQISSVSSIIACGVGSVEPVDVTLPFASATAAEQYEGMLVRLPQTLYVTEHYQLGRFGQVVLSVDARLKQPTNVVLPGADAQALQEQNNLSRIIVDDALNNQNPDPILFARGGLPLSADNTLRGGDTATGITGVMTYTWGGNSASPNAYRVRPVNALNGVINFEPANPRPAAAPAPAGLRVAGMNLLNFFNTFTGCTNGVGGEATDCRGAYNQAEYDRQLPKTVAAILGTQASVIGVIEVENDGYGPDSALAALVDALNAATAPGTYAFINVDRDTGQINALGTDAIKVSLLYKPAVVMPVGNTAALNSVEFVNGGDGDARNRPALAQAFEEIATGGRFVVAVNHLKSKGSACDMPDAGDGQGNCNAVRLNAANLLTAWLASDPTGTGDADTLILGDLNSYAMEDPITAIKAAGYTDLINQFGGPDAYSYVFDGQWGYLDHALGSAGLASQVAAVADWHINSDEPSVLDYNMEFKSAGQLVSLYAPDWFRVADHDPVLVDLNLTPDRPTGFATGSGWIRFSAGAYIPNPELATKAKFAFDVKYLKGAARPTGKSAFMVQGGVPNFVTTTFDWLAISGDTALFQSKGTLNGYGSYIMRVTAQDGAPDALRVRIWDAVTGALVFDNLTPAPLGGGSIQLHK
jgi:predicted extracellular nuclease